MIGEFGQLAYNITDTLWVGRLGAEELAAISLSFPLLFIIISVGIGFNVSGEALISQHMGAGQRERANHAAGQVLAFCLMVSVVLAVIASIYGQQFLRLLGAADDVLPLAWSYVRIVAAGIPLTFIYFIFQAALRATGDTVTPTIIKVGTVAINVILDPLLIFGIGPFPFMGIAGAAVATVTARLVASVVGLFILFTGVRGELHLRPEHMRLEMRTVKKIIRIGVPAAAGQTAIAFARTFLTGLVATFGTYSVAAWGVVNRVLSVVRLPGMGLARATTIMVGQHLGADNPRKAEQSAWAATYLIVGLLGVVALLMVIAAPHVVGLFNDEPEVISIGTEYLVIGVFGYLFLAVQQVICGGLRGAGNAGEQAVLRLLTQWGIQIPLAYWLATLFGRPGIWWGITLSYAAGAVMSVLWFRVGTWKEKVIDDVSPLPDEPAARHDPAADGESASDTKHGVRG